MKLDYDSLPTLMLVAAGLFVMFASPPTVNYDEVESAGIITFQNDDNELNGNPYVLSDDEAMEQWSLFKNQLTHIMQEIGKP